MDTPDSIDRVETAANVYVNLTVDGGGSFQVPVSELDRSKEVDVERVREMGLYPDGYGINAIDIDGTLTFAGHVVRLPEGGTKDLDDLLFKDDGTPKIFDVTITHEALNDPSETSGSDTIENCIVTSSQYNASSGETTESTYEFMGQRIN